MAHVGWIHTKAPPVVQLSVVVADLPCQRQPASGYKFSIARRRAESARRSYRSVAKSRELDDAKRELDLSVQLKVQESLNDVRSQAKSEPEDRLAKKISERETQIAGMQRQIEKLRRQSEQGSSQIQGEALDELESSLSHRFPYDLIQPVSKGVFGGDVIQRVRNHSGPPSGIILWECKRTKAWSDGWISKIREN